MRRFVYLVLLCALPAMAATTVRLHKSPSTVAGYQTMSKSLGPLGGSVVTSVTNTTASGTSIQATQTGGGTALAWMSEPFTSGATLNGSETCNVYSKEAAAANNASFQCQLFKYSGGSLGAVFCTATWGTELTTSIATHAPTCTASSTAFSAGDQLVVKIFIVNCTTTGCPSGTMGAGTPGVTIDYDGPTASADGDTNLVLAETVTFDPYGGTGGTPTLVQLADFSQPDTGVGWGASPSTGTLCFPQPVGLNNLITLTTNADPATGTLTLADNGSNTWNLAAKKTDGTNNEVFYIFYATNTNSATTCVTLQSSTGTTNPFIFPVIAEWTNVATATPLDVSTGNNANSTSITAGSVTPNYSGDLVIEAFWNSYTPTGSSSTVTPGSQSNITWALASADSDIRRGDQWGVYSSTSALNPTMSATASGFVAAAAFFRSANAGTPQPTGMYVTNTKQLWVNSSGAPYNATPRTIQFPCPAADNLMYLAYTPSSTTDMTAVTDSHSQTWVQTAAKVVNGASGGVHNWYIGNATVSLNQTITFTPTVDSDAGLIYCIKGAAVSPFDTTATNSGNQTVSGNINAAAVTPAGPGLVFSTIANDATTLNGTSGVFQFDGCVWSGAPINGGGCLENNGFAVYSNPGTSTVTPTFTEGAHVANEWVSRTDSFLAPSTGIIRRRASVVTK